MGKVSALPNGDTLFQTDDKADWIAGITAARVEGGAVTILTGGYDTRYAAKIRYPEGVEHETPDEEAPAPTNISSKKRGKKAEDVEAPADETPAEEEPPAES